MTDHDDRGEKSVKPDAGVPVFRRVDSHRGGLPAVSPTVSSDPDFPSSLWGEVPLRFGPATGFRSATETDAAPAAPTSADSPTDLPPAPQPATARPVVEPATAPASAAQPASTSATQGKARKWLLRTGVGFVLVAALAGAVMGGNIAHTNKARADRWASRAHELDRQVGVLNSVVLSRTQSLDARTRELNRMAIKVRNQQSALKRSQADVAGLSRRQRELANEKAQVEDARAQLAVQASAVEDVAQAFIDCKSGLLELLSYVLDEQYLSAQSLAGRVGSDCRYAESLLADYNASY